MPKTINPRPKTINPRKANMLSNSEFQMNARPASSVDEWLDPTRNLDWIAAAVHPD